MVIKITVCDAEDDDVIITLTTNLFGHSLLSDYPTAVDDMVNGIKKIVSEVIQKEKDKLQ